jgi:hypothetical protein
VAGAHHVSATVGTEEVIAGAGADYVLSVPSDDHVLAPASHEPVVPVRADDGWLHPGTKRKEGHHMTDDNPTAAYEAWFDLAVGDG